MNPLRRLDQWHKTKPGFLVFGLVELGLAYLFGSLAIDQGQLWQWALTIILVFGALSNFVRIFVKHKK
jgi:hypothetical protein